MEDESGDQFVAYFLPSDETLKKRKREEDDNLQVPSEDELVDIYFLFIYVHKITLHFRLPKFLTACFPLNSLILMVLLIHHFS